MPRGNFKDNRVAQFDPLYNNQSVAKFINHLMKGGKKSVATKVVYSAFDHVGKRQKLDSSAVLELYLRALEHVRPLVEVRSKRIGGANYQVPVEVRSSRAETLAVRMLLNAAKARSGKSMAEKLAAELVDAADETATTGASRGKGGAVKKREDMHKMAAANRAFSHVRLHAAS